jgi:hypothetical protein
MRGHCLPVYTRKVSTPLEEAAIAGKLLSPSAAADEAALKTFKDTDNFLVR